MVKETTKELLVNLISSVDRLASRPIPIPPSPSVGFKKGSDGSLIVSGTTSSSTATPSAVLNGKITVTTAGTRVVLSGSVSVQGVVVQAALSNTGTIYVGNSAVSSSNGYELVAGQAVGLAIDNLNKIYIDANVNNQAVTYLGS